MLIFQFLNIKSILGKPLVFINFFKIHHEDKNFHYFNPGSIEASEFFFNGINGSRENTSLHLFSHLSKQAKYILDIGAFHGLFSFIANVSNPNSIIKAFEPVKSNAEIFKKLVIKNKNTNIEIFEVALSNHTGFAYINNEVEYPSGLSLEHSIKNQNAEKINVVNSKDFFEENIQHPIDLIKIDVERHEQIVLGEMMNVVAEHRPIMIIEVLNQKNLNSIMHMLNEMNYLVFAINEMSKSLLSVKPNFLDYEFTPSGKFVHSATQAKIYNFLFLPIEKQNQISHF